MRAFARRVAFGEAFLGADFPRREEGLGLAADVRTFVFLLVDDDGLLLAFAFGLAPARDFTLDFFVGAGRAFFPFVVR